MAADATPDSPTPRASSGLRRDVLGSWSIAFMVVSAAAPLTVLAGAAPLALSIGGVGVVSMYLAAGAVLLIFAVAFTRMANAIPQLGGFFVYIGHSLGGVVGYAAAMVAVVAYNLLIIGVYGLLAVQTESTLKHFFGGSPPWWVIAMIGIVAVALLGYRGIDLGAKLLMVFIMLEVGILAIMAFSVLFQGGADGLSLQALTPAEIGRGSTMSTLAIASAAYMGYEATVLYRAEARDPLRSIPRATFLAVGFMTVFYTFVVWAVVVAVGNAKATQSATELGPGMFFSVIDRYVGGWALEIMFVLVVSSVYAAELAFHNSLNRYLLSLGRAGALPRAFARVSSRTGSPVIAGAAQTVLALVVVGVFAVADWDPYTDLLLKVNSPGVIGIVGLEALTALAAVVYFVKHRDQRGSRVAIVAGVVSCVLLCTVVLVVLRNFSYLTATRGAINVALAASIGVVFVVALVAGLVLRRTRPQVIAEIGGAVPAPSAESSYQKGSQ